ncbi:MAG: M20 family metallopeptidase [Gaiellales bacterium]
MSRQAPLTGAPECLDAAALLDWLRGETPAMCGLLERLACAESPTLAPAAQAEAYSILASELAALDFAVTRVPAWNVGNHLYARPADRRRGAPSQLVVGHLDTVWPLGTIQRMPVRLEDDRLYGPGVCDMKGGLVQMLFALRALAEHGLAPEVTPVVFIGADEEVGSAESRRYVRLLARCALRALVLEPGLGPDGRLKTARKGSGHFRLVVHGRAAHAGVSPEEGRSAILELSHQIQRLFALNDPAHGITVNVGVIDGGMRPNVVAPEASAQIDVRAPTLDAAREVEQAIRALAPVDPDTAIEVEGSFPRPPMEATRRNLALWEQARAAGARLGLSLDHVAVGGSSDGNLTSPHTATLDGLGVVGGGSHAPDEHVVVSRMAERAALLALLLLEPPA